MHSYNFVRGLFLLTLSCFLVQCEPEREAQEVGSLKGVIKLNQNHLSNAFKVELQNANNGGNMDIAFTGNDGSFRFDNVKQGYYYLNVSKDLYWWAWTVVNGETFISTLSSDKRIEVKGGQTTTVEVQMASETPQWNDLDILDLNGNPITELRLYRYTSQIGFQLFNGTGEPQYWNVGCYNRCYVFTRDGSDSAPWFTSISETEGILSPGNSIGITCTIDDRLYEYQESGQCDFCIQIGYLSRTLPVSY